MPGFPELFFILIILVIIFGAQSLPNLGSALGRAIARRRSTPASTPEERQGSSRGEGPADGPPANDQHPSS
jgi:Sec-independent protein translocase protein TatA